MTYQYPRPLKVPKKGTKARRIWDGCVVEMERLGWVANDANVEGKPTSVRFVFYRLVTERVIPKLYENADGTSKPRKPAQDVSDQLRDLREMGVFPPRSVVDEDRSERDFTGWSTLAAGVKNAVESVRLDPWGEHGKVAPRIWIESNSLLVVLRSVAHRYRVPVASAKGQASLSLCWALARRTPDEATILYLGDLDFSGEHIETSIIDRVEALGDIDIVVERLAITPEQVDEFNLTMIDKYDRRTKTSHAAVETEALGQERIEQIVETRLAELLRTRTPFGSIEEVEADEDEERNEWRQRLYGTE